MYITLTWFQYLDLLPRKIRTKVLILIILLDICIKSFFVHYCPLLSICPLFSLIYWQFFIILSIFSSNVDFNSLTSSYFSFFLYLNFLLFQKIKNIFIKFVKLILYSWNNQLSNWKIRNKFKCPTILETSEEELMSIWRPKMPCFEGWENLGRRDWKLIVYWNVIWILKLCYVSIHGHYYFYSCWGKFLFIF